MVFSAQRAAATCVGEGTIFVHVLNSGSNFGNAYGTSNTIPVRDRALSNCFSLDPFNPEAHSTAHIENALEDHFVEIGWDETLCPQICNKQWSAFYEGNDGTAPVSKKTWGGFDTGPVLDSPPSGGAYSARWWMNNISGGTTWHLYVDWTMDGTADYRVTSPVMNFTHGRAFGETGRRGGEGTGARDDQWNLQYLQSDHATWVYWSDNGNVVDKICNWDWDKVSGREYQTVRISDTCSGTLQT
jgi:hypothetical protein